MNYASFSRSPNVEDARSNRGIDPLMELIGYNGPASVVSDYAYSTQRMPSPSVGPTLGNLFGLSSPTAQLVGTAPYSGVRGAPMQNALGRMLQGYSVPGWLLSRDDPGLWSGRYMLNADNTE